MKYFFENLNEETRAIMLEEIDLDLATENFYEPRSMNDYGIDKYPDILKTCVLKGDANILASLLPRNFFLATNRAGHKTMKNINEVVAYNDFNKYYTRAILRKGISNPYMDIQIYRAKESKEKRIESERLVGTVYQDKLFMQKMLNLFRQSDVLYNETNNFGLLKPNSGLSIRLKKKGGDKNG